jgi:hypothetical protein
MLEFRKNRFGRLLQNKPGNTRSANVHRGQEIRRKMDGKTGGDRVKWCQKTTQTTTRCPIATDHPIASNPKNTHRELLIQVSTLQTNERGFDFRLPGVYFGFTLVPLFLQPLAGVTCQKHSG